MCRPSVAVLASRGLRVASLLKSRPWPGFGFQAYRSWDPAAAGRPVGDASVNSTPASRKTKYGGCEFFEPKPVLEACVSKLIVGSEHHENFSPLHSLEIKFLVRFRLTPCGCGWRTSRVLDEGMDRLLGCQDPSPRNPNSLRGDSNSAGHHGFQKPHTSALARPGRSRRFTLFSVVVSRNAVVAVSLSSISRSKKHFAVGFGELIYVRRRSALRPLPSSQLRLKG